MCGLDDGPSRRPTWLYRQRGVQFDQASVDGHTLPDRHLAVTVPQHLCRVSCRPAGRFLCRRKRAPAKGYEAQDDPGKGRKNMSAPFAAHRQKAG